MTIVTGARHLRKIRKAVPRWWGIVRATESEGQVLLDVVREPRPNPRVDPLIVVQFLWRDEALRSLDDLGARPPKGSRRLTAIWEELVKITTLDQLCELVRHQLKARGNWRSDRRPTPDSGSLPTCPSFPRSLASLTDRRPARSDHPPR